MSALGQKQTFAAQNGMSALPPKADMPAAGRTDAVSLECGQLKVRRNPVTE
jgi:hypothetical protein